MHISANDTSERWFLANGLPAVVGPGALLRGVLPRSAPALSAFAVVMLWSILVVAVTGKHTIDIDGSPTRTEWFVLATLMLVLPTAALAGWLVSRIDRDRDRVRTAIALGSIAVAVPSALLGGPSTLMFADLILDAVVVVIILLCTATGLGSVLGWAARVTIRHLTSMGSLLIRALPVLLLTVLVFFNQPIWTMASTVSRSRLWLAVSFLFVIAAAFLVSNTFTAARSVLPADDPDQVPLSRAELLNVALVLAISQIAQVLAVAFATGLIFLAFGLILISPELLAAWTHGSSPDGRILGMTLPIPNALIQICMFLTALTFMYLAAKAVSDKEYRAQYFEPQLDRMQVTLRTRDRYRAAHRSES